MVKLCALTDADGLVVVGDVLSEEVPLQAAQAQGGARVRYVLLTVRAELVTHYKPGTTSIRHTI